jgi:hypothetical protein
LPLNKAYVLHNIVAKHADMYSAMAFCGGWVRFGAVRDQIFVYRWFR